MSDSSWRRCASTTAKADRSTRARTDELEPDNCQLGEGLEQEHLLVGGQLTGEGVVRVDEADRFAVAADEGDEEHGALLPRARRHRDAGRDDPRSHVLTLADRVIGWDPVDATALHRCVAESLERGSRDLEAAQGRFLLGRQARHCREPERPVVVAERESTRRVTEPLAGGLADQVEELLLVRDRYELARECEDTSQLCGRGVEFHAPAVGWPLGRLLVDAPMLSRRRGSCAIRLSRPPRLVSTGAALVC